MMRKDFNTQLLFHLFLFTSSVLIFSSCGSNYGLDVRQYDKNFCVMIGEGGNSGVLICDTAVLVIDTKVKTGATQLEQWVQHYAPNRHIYIVNTHIHRDHTGGNHLYPNAKIIAGNYGEEFWLKNNDREDMPTIWLADSMNLKFGDETVLIQNIGQAHTFEDLVVYLKNRQVLFTGDVVLNGYHPYFDDNVGSNFDNYLMSFDRFQKEFVIKSVVPGHGDDGGPELIDDFRQYFNDMMEASTDPAKMDEMRAKYANYLSAPINKAGFDQTIRAIRERVPARM
jgi:glyoxylase-like metal-dependent hydrolase (beta-lactamase superfamily II)